MRFKLPLRSSVRPSLLSFAGTLLLLLSCTTIAIKDAEVCGNQPDGSASCFHTLKDEARDLTKIQWDAERIGMVCTKAASFGEWKAEIEKLCSYSDNCTYEVQQALHSFFLNVEKFGK